MEYLNLLAYIILFIVGIIVLFTLLCSIVTLIYKISDKTLSKDLFKYKIHNFYFTITCVFVYISFFVILLYGIRIYNVNHILDLKSVAFLVKVLLQQLNLLSIFIMLLTIIFIFLLSINLLLILVSINRNLSHQVYKLYIFFRYNPIRGATYWKLQDLFEAGMLDLITNTCLKLGCNLKRYLFSFYKDKNNPNTGLPWDDWRNKYPWYHFHTILGKILSNYLYMNKLVLFSPLLIIFYECVMNDFKITYVFYYLLFYIPLMLWKRITTCVTHESFYLFTLFWNIYYKKEICIYALLPKYKEVLDLYLITGLQSNIDLGDIEMYLKYTMRFEAYIDPSNPKPNVFCNSEGIRIEKTFDNRLLSEEMYAEDGDGTVIHEFILLLEKHA